MYSMSQKNVNKSTAVVKVVLLPYLYLKVLFEVPEVYTYGIMLRTVGSTVAYPTKYH